MAQEGDQVPRTAENPGHDERPGFGSDDTWWKATVSYQWMTTDVPTGAQL
jgi:hypothetical protein